MFDKHYHVKTATKYVPYEKSVTINRAPTDKSIKLLAEFEDKARQKVVDGFVINDNVFNGECVVFKDSICHGYTVYFKYKLNGRDYYYEEKVDEFQFTMDKQKAIDRLYQLAADRIASELIKASAIK